jgi:hypothetical protein
MNDNRSEMWSPLIGHTVVPINWDQKVAVGMERGPLSPCEDK